jgi:hypothetical protein
MTEITRESKSSIVFSHPMNLTYIKENWDDLFHVYIKNVTWTQHRTPMELEDFEITHLSEDNKTINFTAKFYEPYMLGLLVKRSDKLFVHLRYDLLDSWGFIKDEYAHHREMLNYSGSVNASETRLWTKLCQKDQDDELSEEALDTKNREKLYVSQRINLQFDFRNKIMSYWRQLSIKMYWYLSGVILVQYFWLFYKNLGLLPMWTLIEYMQLCAFIPLYNFKLIPYLYDAFKPFLISHLVLTNETIILQEMQDDYFNINYDYYWLNVAKLGQALAMIMVLFFFIILTNIIVAILYYASPKESKFGKWIGHQLGQFKFNVYIRYYMLCYFDLTFFSIMKIVDGNDSTQMRKVATMASFVIVALSLVLPLVFIFIICKRQKVMKFKEMKKSFNTLVLKIDKQSKWRLIVPCYFFFRRFLTAGLLSMNIDNTFIFLQYVFILMTSHAYVLYLVSIKPYQCTLLNNYVLANETFYSALIIAIFIFSDATPELNIKFVAAIVLISSIFLLIFANFLMIIVLTCKGRDKLK